MGHLGLRVFKPSVELRRVVVSHQGSLSRVAELYVEQSFVGVLIRERCVVVRTNTFTCFESRLDVPIRVNLLSQRRLAPLSSIITV